MTTIDHQQAAVDRIARVLFCMQHRLSENAYDMARFQGLKDAARREATTALTAATPHLRAGIADEILDDTPGSPLTRGYQRLLAPKPGEHPVRSWEAAVRVMLDALLEGGRK